MPQRPPSETHDSRLTTHALNIGVLGRKGGSAKSTTAFNLAGALAARGRRCLLVDLDSQASLTRALSDDPVPPECGIGARLAEPKRGLRDTIRPVYDLIDLAPGDRSIEVTAAALAQNPAGPLRLRLLLDEVTGDYDAIIIDTAPLLGFTQTSALLGGDLAIVPTRTGAQQDIDALVDIFAMRDELERYRFATARVAAILPSNYHADEAPQRDGLAALHAGYDGLVADPIPHSPLIERAINARVPVVLNSPKSPVAAAFRRLAERLPDCTGGAHERHAQSPHDRAAPGATRDGAAAGDAANHRADWRRPHARRGARGGLRATHAGP